MVSCIYYSFMRRQGIHCCSYTDPSGKNKSVCSCVDDVRLCPVAKQKENKYRAKRTEIDGIKFASKAESEYYSILKKLKDAHIIKGFVLQPKYEILESFPGSSGKMVRGITYIADFKIIHNDDSIEVIDIKGYKITADFKNKWKWFDFLYRDIKKRIVFKNKDGFSYIPG